jgi:hypothetical protein
MDFVNCLFVYDANEVIVDDDVKEPNSTCGEDVVSKCIYEIKEGLFNLLVKEDYLDPCIYGENDDEELNFDIDGDDDEKINHHFKDLDLNSWRMWWPLDVNTIFILKFGQLMHSIHNRNYKKLDTSLLIMELHAFEPKLLVNYLSKLCCK